MKAFMGFLDESQKAIAQGHSWAKIRESTNSIQNDLRWVPSEEEKISKNVNSSVPSLGFKTDGYTV